MFKIIISLILITFSSFSMAKLHFPDQELLPERLTDTQETIGQYVFYGTKGDGFGVLDGRKQDGKVVEIHFLAAMVGQPMMIVIPAKKWSDIPEYSAKGFDDDDPINTKKTIYLLDCAKQSAENYPIFKKQPEKQARQIVPIKQLKGVEQAAAHYLCEKLMLWQKSS